MNALSKPAFLAADAEMARRIHEYDWRATSLGALGTWSASLKTVLHLARNPACADHPPRERPGCLLDLQF